MSGIERFPLLWSVHEILQNHVVRDGGLLLLAGLSAWLLSRFHVLETGSAAMTAMRRAAILPLTLVFVLQWLGQVRNAMKGFVVTNQGISFVEIHAAEEPISFWVGLIWELLLWGALTYVFLRLLAHLG